LPSKQKRVLVAGFDAFDKLDANPSQTIVETLDASIMLPGGREQVQVDTVVLATCCIKAWAKLKRKMDANKGGYSAIILSGVAARREKISLERFALNIRDYRIADNSGHQFEDSPVEKGGPAAMTSTLALKYMSKALTKKGVACEISNHAGTFICNEIYYKCLRYQEGKRSPASVLFVHLPLPKTYVKSVKAAKNKQASLAGKGKIEGISLMRSAIELIIKFSVV